MTQKTLINDVTDTAVWVAHYRAKENSRKDSIFKDPFASKLVGQHGAAIANDMQKTSMYVEWAVVSRTVIIDRLILQLISEGLEAVVNLGAGLDARPYRMNLPANFKWIEVDFPKMIKMKSEILKNDKPVCDLVRIEADLSNDSERWKVLSDAAIGLKKVLILTEGVLPYLSEEQVSNLSKDILAQERYKFWVCEYFDPVIYKYLKDSRRMRKMKNAPFKFYPPNYLGFFETRGWKIRNIKYSGEVAAEFKRKMPMPIWAEVVFKLLPKKIKEEAGKRTGFLLLERKN